QPVDGEIPPLHVFSRIFAVADLIGMAAIAVADVAAKGSDLDYVGVLGDLLVRNRRRVAGPSVGLLWQGNQHYTELRSDCVGFREDLHDLGWSRIGSHIVIRGLTGEQQVAHTSAAQECLMAGCPQAADDLDSVFTNRAHLISRYHRAVRAEPRFG